MYLEIKPTQALTHIHMQYMNSLLELICAKESTFLSVELHPGYSTYLISS